MGRVAEKRLPLSARKQLARIATCPRVYRIGSSTLQALERRGLIRSRFVASVDPSKEYVITKAGLAALEGRDDG